MNELSPIKIQTMTSREIAELTGKRHDNVMADCRKLVEFYAETYSPEKSGELIKSGTYRDSTGRSLPCFELSREASLDLVTGYSLPHRHAVNQRWMELEEAARKPRELSREEILVMALESERERKRLATELEAAKPAIQFHEEVAQSHGELTIREVWQILLNGERGGEKRLREWLRMNRWLTPGTGKVSAYALQRGLMRVRLDPGADGRLWPTPVFTGYGLTMLRHLYRTGELFTVGINKSSLLSSCVVQ
jgi:anti-repressor protein